MLCANPAARRFEAPGVREGVFASLLIASATAPGLGVGGGVNPVEESIPPSDGFAVSRDEPGLARTFF